MLMDYTDMLELFVQKADDICPTFEIAFLDEAQDLSPLQWDIAHAIDRKSKKMYCAGDDDQAIYRWAGADPDYFIDLDCGAEVLETSYRIPLEVHELAERITSRILKRYPKTYNPRAERGSVSRVSTVNQLDMAHGSWLIMAQANYMLSPITQDLRSMGYLYERNGHRSISDKLTEAVNGWERMRKGHAVTLHTAQAIYSLMSGNGLRIARGKKTIKAAEDELFTLESLQKHHGLLATKDMIWSEAMDKIGDMDRAYITALLRRGEKFNATPRIKLSTIHGTKGGEADNVALLTDLSNSAMEGMSDDLHRVFYVGVTRAKQNLFIFEPDDYSRAYDL
jgi:DNA helicase II / ATP-dependent DNA helicase PcrA